MSRLDQGIPCWDVYPNYFPLFFRGEGGRMGETSIIDFPLDIY